MSEGQTKPRRRGFMLGAAVAGAATAVVVAQPFVQPDVVPSTDAAVPPPEKGGGYHMSEHVKRYYKTTLV